jgi:hypothetical protein
MTDKSAVVSGCEVDANGRRYAVVIFYGIETLN